MPDIEDDDDVDATEIEVDDDASPAKHMVSSDLTLISSAAAVRSSVASDGSIEMLRVNSFASLVCKLISLTFHHWILNSTFFGKVQILLSLISISMYIFVYSAPVSVHSKNDRHGLRMCVIAMMSVNCCILYELIMSGFQACYVLYSLRRSYGSGPSDGNVILLSSGAQNYLRNPRLSETNKVLYL